MTELDLGTEHVRFEQRGSVAYCTLDRPERRNALTTQMYVAIRRAVRALEMSDDLHALVITGSGEAFSAGGDMSGDSEATAVWAFETYGIDNAPFEAIRNCPKPVVAMVNGICVGGGLLIATVCDVAVVSDRATFRIPEVLRGLAETFWASYLPAHIGVARARDLVLRARRFSAEEAVQMGLLAHVVPHDELEAATHEVLSDLVQAAPAARAVAKRIINNAYGVVDTMTMMTSIYGPEGREGYEAFVEKRSPNWVPEEFRAGRL
jgi:enoyl-CoA hydratase/carnithine racemase